MTAERLPLTAPLLLTALLLPGCAGALGSADEGRDPFHEESRRERLDREGASPRTLLHEEFQDFPDFTAREVIRRFRPRWLRPRPAVISGEGEIYVHPKVWLDSSYHEDLEVLETVRARDIETIHFLTPREATLRFGTGYLAGALVIATRSN